MGYYLMTENMTETQREDLDARLAEFEMGPTTTARAARARTFTQFGPGVAEIRE